MNSVFARDGFQIFQSAFSSNQCDLLASELSEHFQNQRSSTKNKIGGLRNLLRNPNIAAIASSTRLKSILNELIGGEFFPVRAIFFDKTAESNWLVPWHQDLAIAVSEKIETTGFSGWSIKDGILHVHPPQNILENMVTARLHLDDCNKDNGALKVIPSSHTNGKLNAKQIAQLVQEQCVVCEISKGGILLMRPLLLHASSSSKNPLHRRILHIEFASVELPNGLKWFERA